MLGEVVVDAERVLALVPEELTEGAAGVGRDVEEGRGLGGGGADHDGVLHRPDSASVLHHLLKLLEIDSSFAARKELATELGCPAELMGDSAKMNMWLHKTVLARIADNGGNVPQDLLH